MGGNMIENEEKIKKRKNIRTQHKAKNSVLVYLSEARCPSVRYGLTNSKEIKVTTLRRELQTSEQLQNSKIYK